MKNLNYIYDYSLLRGRIVSKYGTLENFAVKGLKIDRRSLTRLLQNKTRFSQDMIILITNLLDIETKDIPQYFFAFKSQKVASL